MRTFGVGVVLAFAVVLPRAVHAADAARQAEVAQPGAQAKPFQLSVTFHIFTKTQDDGIQWVVVRNFADVEQVPLIRQHLREMQTKFHQRDFAGPTRIQGHEMPGLALLEAAKPGAITYNYWDVDGGAELRYRTSDVALVAALRAWFDAQVSDHGTDAVEGHGHSFGSAPTN